MCPLKRGVRLREVSAYRGSTVVVNCEANIFACVGV